MEVIFYGLFGDEEFFANFLVAEALGDELNDFFFAIGEQRLFAAWAGLADFQRPFMTSFAEHDDITRFFAKVFQERVPGADSRAHQTIQNAGHFVQEDAGEEVGRRIAEWLSP